ncbi:MAG: G1 family glutamic endopeptidase [Candidatus Sulfotelmatobacter sp.]
MKNLSLSMIAILGLFVSSCAQAQTAASISQAGHASLPHVVPTNLPGVYAFTQPPAGFEPLNASKEDLESWGYPPRPDVTEGTNAQARWLEEVNPALQRSVPDLVSRPNTFNRQVIGLKVKSSSRNSTAASSSNWSGYALVTASGGQPFYKVTGRWTVPSVKQAPGTCSGGWDYSAQWIGIDGFSDDDLLQSGSAADVFCDIGQSVTEYFPWVEWLPSAELVIYKNAATETLYPFVPGDYLIVTVSATNFSGGVSTNGTLNFADVTQSWSVALTFTAASLGGSEVTGKSAEWIVERPEVGGSLATLPDYVANPWWDAGATDLTAVAYAPGTAHTATAYNITMLDKSSSNVSFVDLFGTDALWFFPEGSAVK